MLSRREPFEFPVVVLPGEVVTVQFKTGVGTKGTKGVKGVKGTGCKINVCIHVHFKTDSLGRGRSTNMVSSNVESILLDDRGGRDDGSKTHIVSMVAPDFKVTNAVKSIIYFSTDSFAGIPIDEVMVVNGGRRGGTFVGGKGGWVGGEPLVPGLHGSWPGVSGIVSSDINIIKKKIKKKFDGISGFDGTSDGTGGISGVGRIDVVSEGLQLGYSGFAKATRNYTYGLDKLGCNVRASILDKDTIGSTGTPIGNRVLQLSGNGTVCGMGGTNGDEASFYITMNYPTGVKNHHGFYNIGFIMFETVDFPQNFVNHLNYACDEVWTPSDWGRDTMMRAGLGGSGGGSGNRISKDCDGGGGGGVRTMPLGVDTELFNPEREGIGDRSKIAGNMKGFEGKYKFLSVFGFSERKGVSILVRAFSEEFAGRNDVVLIIKSAWYGEQNAWRDINMARSGIANPPLIHLDMNIYTDEVMANIYKNCDAFVLASRGEGWSLGCCEAMSMGLPTISTGYSGNTMFMNDDNSYLIRIDGFGPEPRCNWITSEYKGKNFAIPSKEHLRQLLRHVFEHREEGIEKGKRAREWMVKNFDWKVSCQRMKNRLEEIAKEG